MPGPRRDQGDAVVEGTVAVGDAVPVRVESDGVALVADRGFAALLVTGGGATEADVTGEDATEGSAAEGTAGLVETAGASGACGAVEGSSALADAPEVTVRQVISVLLPNRTPIANTHTVLFPGRR